MCERVQELFDEKLSDPPTAEQFRGLAGAMRECGYAPISNVSTLLLNVQANRDLATGCETATSE